MFSSDRDLLVQRGNVAVEYHRVSPDRRSLCKLNLEGVAGATDAGNVAVVVNLGSCRNGTFRHRFGQALHATLDTPHTGTFGVCDQHQRRRRLERRRPRIGRVAPEKLAQFRVAEYLAELIPERREGLGR